MKTGFFGSHDLGASSHDNLVHCFESMMPYCRSRWLEIQRRRKTNGTQSHLRTHHQWPEDLSVGPLYLKPCHLQLGVGWMSLHEYSIPNLQFHSLLVPAVGLKCTMLIISIYAFSCHFSLYFWCRATNKITKILVLFSINSHKHPICRDIGMLLSLSIICLCFGIRLIKSKFVCVRERESEYVFLHLHVCMCMYDFIALIIWSLNYLLILTLYYFISDNIPTESVLL